MTLKEFTLPEHEFTTLCAVNGDCMAGAGIFDGDIVVVALNRVPCENAPCLCRINGRLVIKRFLKTMPNGMHAVGTCYDFGEAPFAWTRGGTLRMDCGFFTPDICGAVIACIDPGGAIRWARDYKDFPKKFEPQTKAKSASLVALA